MTLSWREKIVLNKKGFKKNGKKTCFVIKTNFIKECHEKISSSVNFRFKM